MTDRSFPIVFLLSLPPSPLPSLSFLVSFLSFEIKAFYATRAAPKLLGPTGPPAPAFQVVGASPSQCLYLKILESLNILNIKSLGKLNYEIIKFWSWDSQ